MSNIRTVKVSFFNNAKDQYADVHEIPWDDFARGLLDPVLVQGDKTGQPAYSPTQFLDNRRKGDNALLVHFGVVDVDDAPFEVLERHRSLIQERKLDAVIYQTWRTFEAYPKGLYRYRIVVPFSRPINTDTEWGHWWPAWSALWGGEASCVDQGVICDKARIYFGPCLPASTPPEAVRGGMRFEGDPVDVDALLAAGAQPKDTARIDNGTPIKYDREVLKGQLRRLKKQTDPKKLALVAPLKAVIDGDRFAGKSEQHNTLTRLTWFLVENLPNADLGELAKLFVPSLELMQREGTIDKWPDVEKDYLLSARNKQIQAAAAQTQTAFARGDSVEITDRVITELREVYDDLVSDEGGLWGLRNNVWHPIQSVEVSRMVLEYSRQGLITIEEKQVRAVNKFVLLHNSRPEFFAARAPGRAFNNGFVRVTDRGLILEPLTRDHRARFAYDFAIDLGATPPARWLAFLEETYPGEPEKVELLQEFFGAALAGVATQFNRALLLMGPGHDGKSQVLGVLAGLFMPDEICSISPAEWGKDQFRSQLVNKGLNWVSDLSSGKGIADSGFFKQIINGEPTSAKVVQKEVFNFTPKAAHAFSINGFPRTDDHTFGYHRRWLIIKHERQQPVETATIGIGARILAEERAAIMAWALRGAERLLQRGKYNVPDSVKEATEDYMGMDPIQAWMNERCEEGGETALRPLHQDYVGWCNTVGQCKPVGEQVFALALKSKGMFLRRTKKASTYRLVVQDVKRFSVPEAPSVRFS